MQLNARRLVMGLLMAALLAVALVAPANAVGSRARSGWMPNGTVNAIALTPTRVYIGGRFTTLTNSANGHKVKAHGLAALDRRSGALITSWHASANFTVHALSVFDNKLIVGGSFTQIDGHARLHLAALGLVHGDLRTFFVPTTNASVYALLPVAARIFVGGKFNLVNGAHASKLAELDRLGHRIANWPAGPGNTDKSVYTLNRSFPGTSVVVGGAFTTLAGVAQPFLGDINIQSGLLTHWRPAPACPKGCFVHDVSISMGLVFAGIGGPGGQLRAYRSNATTAYFRPCDGDVQTVSLHNNQLFVGGHFTRFDHVTHHQIALLHAASGALTGFSPHTTGPDFPGVLAIAARSDFVRVGGAFTSLGGRSHYAELPN
jgi:hypothetical protein